MNFTAALAIARALKTAALITAILAAGMATGAAWALLTVSAAP